MSIYKFIISDEPKRNQYFRYGELMKVFYKNGEIIEGLSSMYRTGKLPSKDITDQIEKISLKMKFQKSETELFPNFLSVRMSYHCADENALSFINKLNIPHKTIPILTDDESPKYSSILFEIIDGMVDLDASNLYINDVGRISTKGKNYFNNILSKIVLKSKILNTKGIFTLNETYQDICDEETKNLLEQSGLTGFYFEELKVIGN